MQWTSLKQSMYFNLDVYTLQKNQSSYPYKVYCHMTDIPECGGEG